MNRKFKAAIIGVKNLRGKTLKETLEKIKVEFDDFYLYEPGIGKYALFDSFRDEAKVVLNPTKDEMPTLDLAFFTVPVEDEIFNSSRISVDLSGTREELPTIVSGLNDREIKGGKFENPLPGSIGISHVIYPVSKYIDYGFSALIEPVSESGEGGMDELFSQAVNLLNMEEIPEKVLKDILAFDLFPKRGRKGKGRFIQEELKVVKEIRKATGIPDFYSIIMRSGIFHRYSALIFLKLNGIKSIKKLEESISSSQYVMIEKGKISPSRFYEEEGFFVHVSDIKKGEDGKFWLWAVFDNVKRGSVLNAIEIGFKALKFTNEITDKDSDTI